MGQGSWVSLVVHGQHKVITQQPRSLLIVACIDLEVILPVGPAGDAWVAAHQQSSANSVTLPLTPEI